MKGIIKHDRQKIRDFKKLYNLAVICAFLFGATRLIDWAILYKRAQAVIEKRVNVGKVISITQLRSFLGWDDKYLGIENRKD